MEYYSRVGHYLLYPLAVLAMTFFFFYIGFKTGKRMEKTRISSFNKD
jgi:hypothetical protein